MSFYDEAPTQRTGKWLYDGQIDVEVKIVRLEFTPGSGDVYDPPETANDRDKPCYVIMWGSTIEPGRFPSAAGFYASLEEAERQAERLAPGIRWTEHSPKL